MNRPSDLDLDDLENDIYSEVSDVRHDMKTTDEVVAEIMGLIRARFEQGPQEHPDTERLDWLEAQVAVFGHGWYWCPYSKQLNCLPMGHKFELLGDTFVAKPIREAIDDGMRRVEKRDSVAPQDVLSSFLERERNEPPDSTNEADTQTPCASAGAVLAQESTGVGEPSTATDDGGGDPRRSSLSDGIRYWEKRCAKAESCIAELQSQLSERDDALSEIRARIVAYDSEHSFYNVGMVCDIVNLPNKNLAAAWRKRQQEGE